jgi:hypothetical protein
MLGFLTQRLMELDVDKRCGASHGERTEARTNSRNGYRQRDWETRAGTVPLPIPKLRQGSYFPPFLEPRRTAERAWSREPMCRASGPARWTSRSRPESTQRGPLARYARPAAPTPTVAARGWACRGAPPRPSPSGASSCPT